MRLLILDNVEKGKPDAFIKLEDICFSTIAYPKADGEYMWLIDNETGFFSCHHAYFKAKKSPQLIAIFKISGENYELCWISGDISEAKKRFSKLTGLCENIIEPEPIRDEPIIYTENAPETFWDCNAESFNKLFSKNPENIELSELIPGSKWVNVEEENYVFGIIYNDDEAPLYLCYAFPLPWSETPPEKLEGYCQWIPIDFTCPHDNGYWVIYINATTGERVK